MHTKPLCSRCYKTFREIITQGGENGYDWFEQRMLLTNLELIDFISLTMRDPARKKIAREIW